MTGVVDSMEGELLIYAQVSCKSTTSNDESSYSITISRKAEPLIKTSYESARGHTSTERVYLGSFGLYEDLIVTIKNNEENEKIERVSIPIICLERGKPSTLVLTFATIEISIVFEAAEDSLTYNEHDMKEEYKTASALPIATPISDYPSGYRRNTLFLRSADLYKLLKASSSALIQRRQSELVLVVHTIRLLATYLLDGCRLVGLVVVDVTAEAVGQLDQVIADLLEALDSSMEGVRALLVHVLVQFVELVKRQTTSPDTLLGKILQRSVGMTKPFLQLSWRLTRPIARPLLSPLSKLTDQWRKDGQVGPLLDEALDCVQVFLEA